MLLEGIMRFMYVTSAYLHNMLPADTVFKSPVFTTYKAGPIENPCMMLAEISTRSDCWFWYVVLCEYWPRNLTLNAVIALILLFSPKSIDFQADYITVVEDRPILSVKYCLPVPVFYFWPKL